MKRRDRLNIMISILDSLVEKKKMTNLQFSTKLNYKSLKNHLDQLSRLGFVEENNGYYIITDKGRDFLKMFDINR